jgi:TLP18.3/Psb32/MOLO-1 phosphatase superfamily protein
MIAWCPTAPVRRAGARLSIAVTVLLWASLSAFAVSYPALTGRVVDQANIIPTATRDAIAPKLANLESKSGIQLVVATVKSLQGEEIEPDSNGLFRTWKLGEKAVHANVGPPNTAIANRDVPGGCAGALPSVRARRVDAASGAPRCRPSRGHGAIPHPRSRPKDRAHRHSDLRLPRRALCAHHRRRWRRGSRAAIRMGAAVDALVAHVRDGRIADGFVAAIDACGNVLATHFPRTDTSRDVLPDRIYMI